MNNRLHVGNLAVETTAATLIEAFRRDGRTVRGAEVIMAQKPRRSRGFAFVEMASETEAVAAMASLNGTSLDGRLLRVNLADPPKSRFGRGRG